MAIGGAFLGGGVEVVPAGSCKLELEILTEDRANLTATFTIKGTSTYTVTAGADGRAVYTVPAGQTYTVSVNTTGYDNIARQTVIAESGTVRYVRFEAFAGRVKRSGDTMTGTLSINNGNFIIRKTTLGSNNSATAVTEVGRVQFRSASNETANLISISSPSNNSTYLRATRKVGENNVDADIIAIVGVDGKRYAVAPSWSPGTNDNSDKILTIKMANSLPSLVHTTGNETIAGQKTFTANPTIRSDNLEAGLGLMCNKAVGDLTGWTRNALIGFFWMDYVYNGFITTTRDPTNSAMELTASNGSGANASILIIQPNDGSTGWATAPTTPTNASGTEIVTANWALNNFQRKITYGTGDPPSGGQAGDIYIEI